MRQFFTVLFVLAIGTFSQAQKAPKFEKTPIGNSGAYVYMPAKGEPAELTYSEDKSKVYTMNVEFDDYLYDVVFVELAEPLESETIAEGMLIEYIDYLKTVLETKECAGYGKGRTLSTHNGARGVIDYCKDSDNYELQITGWADKKYLAVLIITGEHQYPNPSVSDIFFKGIRFPGD